MRSLAGPACARVIRGSIRRRHRLVSFDREFRRRAARENFAEGKQPGFHGLDKPPKSTIDWSRIGNGILQKPRRASARKIECCVRCNSGAAKHSRNVIVVCRRGATDNAIIHVRASAALEAAPAECRRRLHSLHACRPFSKCDVVCVIDSGQLRTLRHEY